MPALRTDTVGVLHSYYALISIDAAADFCSCVELIKRSDCSAV